MNSREGSLLVYSGPSGVGKGTILVPLIEKGLFALSVSATTRKPRVGECDGVSYHFLDNASFEQKIASGDLLEYAQYNGNYYGTPKEYVLKKLREGIDVILEIEVMGALQIKQSFPEAIFIFVMPPSFEELKRRLTDRNTETKEQIESRLAAAKKEISYAGQYDFVIINHDLHSARAQLLAAARAGRLIARKNYKFIEEVQKLC